MAINRKAKHQGASKPAEFAPNGTPDPARPLLGHRRQRLVRRHRRPACRARSCVLNCTFQGNGRAESHQRWSTGMLYDNCRAPDGGIELRNRGSMGSGHGWSMGWGVVWNCEAKDYIVQNPPGVDQLDDRQHRREQARAAAVRVGADASRGRPRIRTAQPVTPESLYLAQLAERLGPQALKNIGYASTSPKSARPGEDRRPSSSTTRVRADDKRPRRKPGHRPPGHHQQRARRRSPVRRLAGAGRRRPDLLGHRRRRTEARLEFDTEGALDINALELREASRHDRPGAGLPGRGLRRERLEAAGRGDHHRRGARCTVSRGRRSGRCG